VRVFNTAMQPNDRPGWGAHTLAVANATGLTNSDAPCKSAAGALERVFPVVGAGRAQPVQKAEYFGLLNPHRWL